MILYFSATGNTRFVATELAKALDLPFDRMKASIDRYNALCEQGCDTDFGKPAYRLSALRTAPFYGYMLRPGITFSYLSLALNERMQVEKEDGGVFKNIFAAGEITSGNVLGQGYMAGFGMTIGTVFGRRAGKEAMNV